jgi:PadR family transcriptional regulator PadR
MLTDESKLKPQWFQILLAVSDAKRHGSGIRDEVLKQTDGRMRLWPTSLYGSLRELAAAGLLQETQLEGTEGQGDRRRFYEITPRGRDAVLHEVERMKHTIAMVVSKHENLGNT